MIYTLGHSSHPIATFIGLLQKHGVQVLADIRSVPMSRFNPQFRQKDLRAAVEAAGIAYVYLGDDLGGQAAGQRDRATRLPYEARTKLPEFQRGMEKLKKLAAEKPTAVMCAEKEPLNCHRTLLVARALAEAGAEVQHILAGGDLRPQQEVENDLIAWRGVADGGLFAAPRAELLAEAYARRSGAGDYKRK